MKSTKVKATKSFRIGEWVTGGIIKVDINGDKLTIKFLDYFTKQMVLVEEVNIYQEDAYRTALNFLEINGTSYYGGIVIKWIETKVTLNNGNHFNW